MRNSLQNQIDKTKNVGYRNITQVRYQEGSTRKELHFYLENRTMGILIQEGSETRGFIHNVSTGANDTESFNQEMDKLKYAFTNGLVDFPEARKMVLDYR